MRVLDRRDGDEDRITLSDFNDETPPSARAESTHTEALLKVFGYSLGGDPALDVSDMIEDGVGIVIDADLAIEIVGWLMQFFNGVEDSVTLTGSEARALRAHLKGHAVPDVTAQLESLAAIQGKLDRAR